MHKVIALEGLPGSGKTSIIDYLRNKYHGIEMIQEIILDEELWIKAQKNEDQNFFWKNDLAKIKLANKLKINRNVVMDRCHLSTLAYNYSKMKLNMDNDFLSLMRDYKTQIIEQSLQVDVCVYIDTSPTDSLKRKDRNVNIKDPWRNIRCLKYMDKYYKKFLTTDPDRPLGVMIPDFYTLNQKFEVLDILLAQII